MSLELKKCDIQGVFEIHPVVYSDNRGYFFEQYNSKKNQHAGLEIEFVQDNISFSKKNTLRGLHFQKKYSQAKLMSVLQGQIYDVAVDIRQNSPTFLKYHGVVLDSQKHNQLFIPVGFAHGFLVLSETALVSYKCSEFYHPEDEDGLLWNDPKIGIDWNKYLNGKVPLLSEKDKLYAPLK